MSHHIHVHKDIPKPKSFLRYYWILWAFTLVIAYTIKVYINPDEKTLANIATFYFLITILLFMSCNIFEGSRLLEYLKAYHNDQWVKLTTVMGFPGGRNSFKTLGFVFSDKDLKDPNVTILKKHAKFVILYMIVVFASSPFLLFTLLTQ